MTLPLSLEDLLSLRQSLNDWGKCHFRSFPWRESSNPYHILLAEVFLHRTQASQAERVYRHFVQRYPQPIDLLNADAQESRSVLFALGLHWRVDLLMNMVREIQEQYAGQVPRDRQALLTLPGVSDYIAGAVRCFAWNEPEVLLDTNTVRIVGRLMGWKVKDSSRRNTRFRLALETLLDREHPRTFNYALLDLAHLVCLKRQPPLCEECPLKHWCQFKNHRQEQRILL